MDDFYTWTVYAYDVAKTDKLKDYLDFLNAQAEKDDILKQFSPYLINLVYAYRAEVLGWDHTGQLYLNTKAVWPEIYKVTLQAMKQDPDNYLFLIGQAKSFAGWGRFKSARLVFNAIGDHWLPKSGTQEDFDKFKRVAFHQQKSTWHLCLSTAEQAEER